MPRSFESEINEALETAPIVDMRTGRWLHPLREPDVFEANINLRNMPDEHQVMFASAARLPGFAGVTAINAFDNLLASFHQRMGAQIHLAERARMLDDCNRHGAVILALGHQAIYGLQITKRGYLDGTVIRQVSGIECSISTTSKDDMLITKLQLGALVGAATHLSNSSIAGLESLGYTRASLYGKVMTYNAAHPNAKLPLPGAQ